MAELLTDEALLAKARFTLESTRSNEHAGHRPDKPREATLGGIRAVDHICWARHCTNGEACGGEKAHVLSRFDDACGGAVNMALGGVRGCRKAAGTCPFSHPSPSEVRRELEAWWCATKGTEPVWSHVTAVDEPQHNSALHGGERSQATADGQAKVTCTVPRDVQRARLERHAAGSAHVRRFLEPGSVFDTMVADEALRPLLSLRKCAKEISEAYGAAAQVVAALDQIARRRGAVCGAGGRGAVLLDVCSGVGLTSVVLSFLLPHARIVLFDNNGAMQLAHVSARPSLHFAHLDLFGVCALPALGEAAAGGSVCVAIGTHLCGALSPRLIDAAIRLESVHALVLSPCCLRGALGAAIGRAAKARASSAYDVLVTTLGALCRDELRRQREDVGDSRGDEAACQPCDAADSNGRAKDETVAVAGEAEVAVAGEAEVAVADGDAASTALEGATGAAEGAHDEPGAPRAPQRHDRPLSPVAEAVTANPTVRECDVRVEYDPEVLSPARAFIVVCK